MEYICIINTALTVLFILWLEDEMDFVVKLVLSLGTLVAVTFFAAIPFWVLWNRLMPKVLNLRRVTYFQAWGFVLMAWILFGSSFSVTF